MLKICKNPLSLIAEAVCLYFAQQGNTMLKVGTLSFCGAIGSSTDSVAQEVVTPEEAAPGPQFWYRRCDDGLCIPITINKLSVAFGISSQGGSQSDSNNEAESLGGTIRKIETAVGLGL